MRFSLSYTEVENLIKDKTNKELPMSFSGSHTVRIGYKVPLMGTVGLDITVENIQGSNICISYGGGASIDFMVRTALKQAQGQPGMDIVEVLDNSRLMLALGKNPQLATLFEHITVQDIHFDEQNILIDFTPNH